MQLLTALDELLRLETTMAKLYSWLSETFETLDPDASAVFFRMSMQEQSHANLIRYHKRVLRGTPSTTSEVELDLSQLQRVTQRVAAFTAQDDTPTLAEAIELATFVESSAAEAIHARIASESQSEVSELVATLATEDQRHLAALAALRDRGARSSVA